MTPDQAWNLAKDLETVCHRLRSGRYVGGTGTFLDFRMLEDLETTLAAVGYTIIPISDASKAPESPVE